MCVCVCAYAAAAHEGEGSRTPRAATGPSSTAAVAGDENDEAEGEAPPRDSGSGEGGAEPHALLGCKDGGGIAALALALAGEYRAPPAASPLEPTEWTAANGRAAGKKRGGARALHGEALATASVRKQSPPPCADADESNTLYGDPCACACACACPCACACACS